MVSAYEAAMDALGKIEPARVLKLNEVLTGIGTGWVEWRIPADPDEGEKAACSIRPCAWCMGGVAEPDDEYSDSHWLKREYGRIIRVWDRRPTDEERAEAAWQI